MIPAIRWRCPRDFSPAASDVGQPQETQIVQPCKTLRDFLPGFRPLPIRRGGSFPDLLKRPTATSGPIWG